MDLVLVALKTTANKHFESLIGPLVGKHTVIVTLQNGLGNEARLADLFGAERIIGGLCFVCLHRIEPGVVHHFAYGKLTLGELASLPQKRTHEIARFFRNAGVQVQVTDNLERALCLGDRLGGHLVLGHADGTVRLSDFSRRGDDVRLRLELPADLRRYVAFKGSVATTYV